MCCVHSLVHIPQASPLIGISPDWPHRLGRGLELACLVILLISFHCAIVTGCASGDWQVSAAGPCRGVGGYLLGCTWGRLL